MMKNLIALTLVAFAGVAFAGEKTQAPAAKPVAVTTATKACDCQVVEVSRRPLLGRRAAVAPCCETVLVPATKTVTVYETKKVLVEKEVKVPVQKEVKTLVPAKVVAAPVCDCAPVTSRVRGRLLGVRNRVAGVADCAACN